MTSRPFTQLLARSLCKALFVFAAIALFVVTSHVGQANRLEVRPQLIGADDSVAGVLVQEHGCWHDQAPKGVKPTRAVVELDPRKGPVLVPAEVGYKIWLAHAPGTLYAFCP